MLLKHFENAFRLHEGVGQVIIPTDYACHICVFLYFSRQTTTFNFSYVFTFTSCQLEPFLSGMLTQFQWCVFVTGGLKSIGMGLGQGGAPINVNQLQSK